MAFLKIRVPISSNELLIVSTAHTSACFLLCASTEDQMSDPGLALGTTSDNKPAADSSVGIDSLD